jgi:hypothetical protein
MKLTFRASRCARGWSWWLQFPDFSLRPGHYGHSRRRDYTQRTVASWVSPASLLYGFPIVESICDRLKISGVAVLRVPFNRSARSGQWAAPRATNSILPRSRWKSVQDFPRRRSASCRKKELVAEEIARRQAASAVPAAPPGDAWFIFFIFPQLIGLGRIAMAKHFAFRDFDQAKRYLADPMLGERLRHGVWVMVRHKENPRYRFWLA